MTAALANGPAGSYQLQAAIAAVHAEAASAEQTDWRQISALYELLERVAPNPHFTLNRVVAVAMVHGPAAGLELLAGDAAGAADAYEAAARRTTSLPERDVLQRRAIAACAAITRTAPPG